jgi:radical SAM protein with 4Fe4S-binding SPASM domain
MQLKAPLTSQLELTYTCNHFCTHCYNYEVHTTKLEPFSNEHFTDIVKKIGDIDIFAIDFTGGEPFLRREALYECLPVAKDYGIATKLNTNLSLKLEENDLKNLEGTALLVSLPSGNKETYENITHSTSYDAVLSNIKKAMNYGLEVSANMVVSQLSKQDIYETGKLFAEMGGKNFCVTPMSPCTKKQKELFINKDEVIQTLDVLLDLKKDFGLRVDALEPILPCSVDLSKYRSFVRRSCTAGRTHITIDPAGNVRPCSHFPTDETYGNILDEPFDAIWNKLSEWKDGKHVPKSCDNCAYLAKCFGGCRLNARIFNGSLDAQDPWAGQPIAEFKPLEIKINMDKQHSIRPDIKFREESPDYYTLYSGGKTLFINKSSLDIMLDLKKGGKFVPNDVLKENNLDRYSFGELLTIMLSQRYLSEGK